MKQLNTVICSLNSQYIHSSLAPYYLLAGIKKFCPGSVCARIVESTINEKIQNTVDKITTLSPKVIGFSCYIWNITTVYSLISAVKEKLPNAIIVLGGPEVSYNAGEVLQNNPFVDFIISGEGEKPFSSLLCAILEKKKTFDIPGVCYKKDGHLIISEPFVDDGEPPSPFIPEYFDSLHGRIAYIESSRGCPYSCAFCLSGRCGGVRFFDIERTKREMVQLAKSGTQTIKFVDRTFNADKNRAAAIFEYIINNRDIFSGVCFHFEIAGDILNAEIINILKKAPAGAIQFEIGLQTFNEKTLEKINRKTNIKRLKENIESIMSLGTIHTHIDLIAGLPYDTIKTIEESFNLAFSFRPHMLQFGFLKILHGSPMAQMRSSFPCTHTDTPPYEVTETPCLSKDELISLHNLESALDRLYNSGRFKRTIDYLLSFYSPFELFYKLGQEKLPHNMPLDDYTEALFTFFSKEKEVNQNILRDKMVCDRLATNSTGTLPRVLHIFDKNLKKYKKAVPKKEGVKTGFACLYTENVIVYAHYDSKNPVTGEYALYKIKPLTD